MALFNLHGVKICGTVPQLYSPGKHISPLKLSNLPSGRYIYRVTAGETFADAVFSVRH
jgi:hypothetical protein